MSHFVEPSARRAWRARARLVLLTTALALLPALPAGAARVLQVRVGEHPEFTRVVFELDERAGYKLERRSGPQGSELQVTLDASAATRKLTRRGSDVPRVEVKAGEQAVALIRLRKGDLAVKEMILSNPYRVVLDVMRDLPPAATAAKPKPAPAPKPVAKVEPKPEPKPAPKAEPAPPPKPVAKVEPKPEPKPAPKAEPAPPPKPVVKVEPKPEPKPAPKAEPAPPPMPVAETKPIAPPAPAEPVAKAPEPGPRPAVPPSDDKLARLVAQDGAWMRPPTTPPEQPDAAAPPIEPGAAPPPPPAVAEVPKTAEPQKPTAAKQPAPVLKKEQKGAASWLSNPLLLAGAGGVLVCVLALVFLLRRRRALPNDLDVTAIAEEHGAGEAGAASETAMSSEDESSFAGLFDDDEVSTPPRSAAGAVVAPPAKAAAPVPKGTPLDSLFDDDEPHGPPVRQGAAKMTQPTTDLPTDRSGARPAAAAAGARGPAAGPAVGGDVMRLVQELERRIGQLESKLDQANEAREKLERQVAAQSEELRVQRAAIARTQRALRTMSRGDEEKATEPALREETATKVRPGGL